MCHKINGTKCKQVIDSLMEGFKMNKRTDKAIDYCRTAKIFKKTDFALVLKSFHAAPDSVGVHRCSGCLHGFLLKLQKRFKNGFTKKEMFCILRTLTLKNKHYIMAGHPPNVVIID